MNDELKGAAPVTLDVPVCRALPHQVELERAAGEAMPDMRGHFSIFDTWYEIDSVFEGRFLERVAPGSFKKTIQENGMRVPVLLEHGHDPTVSTKPLGSPRSLGEDDVGAAYVVQMFDTSYNRDLLPALQSGVYGSSFRFQALKDEWQHTPPKADHNPEGIPERTLKEVRLLEFGPTLFPANPEATASARSTTDRYYEQLRHEHPEEYAEVLRSVRLQRTPAPSETPDTPAVTDTGAVERADETESAPTEPRKHSEDTPVITESRGDIDMEESMTVSERAARQSELKDQLKAMTVEYAGNEFTAEARAKWDKLNAEYDAHERAIKDDEARRSRIAQIDGTYRPIERVEEWRPEDNIPAVRVSRDPFDLAALRQQARSMDDMPGLMRDNARRIVDEARFPGLVRREDAQEQVEHLLNNVDDAQGTLARRIIQTGSPLYDRAFGKAVLNQPLSPEEQRAMSLTTTEGGFAVPYTLDPTIILTSTGVVNPLRQIARVEQIVGNTWKGVSSAGVSVTRVAEGTEATDDAPTIAQPSVTVNRVQGFIPFSVEIDQDWGSMRSEISRLLADGKDTEEATSFVTGDGSTGVQPGGVVGSLAAGSKVTANTLTVGAVFSLEEAMAPRFRANASILANRAIFNLIRQLDTAGGSALWERIGNGLPSQLLGYPAYEISTMDATVTISDEYLLMGDFRNFLIVDRVGMNVELVPHLMGANRRPTGQRGIYAIWRNNSVILTSAAFMVLTKLA